MTKKTDFVLWEIYYTFTIGKYKFQSNNLNVSTDMNSKFVYLNIVRISIIFHFNTTSRTENR